MDYSDVKESHLTLDKLYIPHFRYNTNCTDLTSDKPHVPDSILSYMKPYPDILYGIVKLYGHVFVNPPVCLFQSLYLFLFFCLFLM